MGGKIIIPSKIMRKDCYCQRKALEKKEQQDKKNRENAALMERYRAAEIPPRFLNWDFKTVDDTENKRICEQYVKTFDINLLAGNGIFMIGTKGLGKTTLAICIQKELIKKGYTALVISFREILNRVLATRSPGSLKTQRQVMDELLKFDFIILDDFGRETYTDKQIELAFFIVDEMNKFKKCVAITANPEMIEKLKDRNRFNYAEEFIAILDRLNEMCKLTLVFEGTSLRSQEG